MEVHSFKKCSVFGSHGKYLQKKKEPTLEGADSLWTWKQIAATEQGTKSFHQF